MQIKLIFGGSGIIVNIFISFRKIDDLMISKKGVRSNTVKEIIRELSELDDEQV